jgi:glutaconate CoA-transferase, subunit A
VCQHDAVAELLALDEAVARLVNDGDTVAMEGFTHLIPHAAGHEIIRQGRRNLHLVRMTPDVVYDQLIGAGCADRLTFSWGGNPGVGSLQRFRDAVENGWTWTPRSWPGPVRPPASPTARRAGAAPWTAGCRA